MSSDAARDLLLTAKPETMGDGSKRYFIERTLGWQTWQTGGERGKRRDVADLYRAGLVKEWFSPWSPPLFLTASGEALFHELTEGQA